MKLNEKNLVAMASASNLSVDKEGYLNKRGEVNKSFRKRWFVLKGNLLYYFEKKIDKEPVGVIIVEGCTVELAEEDQPYSFKLVFHGPGDRTFILGADSQELMEEWMKAIASASYDYMKLMVLELQRQVDELTEMERLQSLGLVGEEAPPTAPPRQRHNPFNSPECNGSIKKVTVKRLTFRELHSQYGAPVVAARAEWLKTHAKTKTGPLSENVLITL